MFAIRLHNPVQITAARIDKMGEICFHEDVNGKALPGLAIQREVDLLHDLASRSVSTKEILCADLVFEVGYLVADRRRDQTCLGVLRKRIKNRVEEDFESV